MTPLDLVNLTALMERTSGSPDLMVGLIDGPIAVNHPYLAEGNIRELPGKLSGTCTQGSSAACRHGTFVAGILCAKRSSVAPALCPHCTLLVRPIFTETASEKGQMPSTTPAELGGPGVIAGKFTVSVRAKPAWPLHILRHLDVNNTCMTIAGAITLQRSWRAKIGPIGDDMRKS